MTDDLFAPLRPLLPFNTVGLSPYDAAIAHAINTYPEREALIAELVGALRQFVKEPSGVTSASFQKGRKALASAAALGLADRKEGGT